MPPLRHPENFVQPVAFYVQPLIWVGAPPGGVKDVTPQDGLASIDFEAFAETIVERELPHDLRVRIERDGMVVFDFGSYAPRAALEPKEMDIPEALNGLRRRSQLMNAFQACLVTATAEVDKWALQDPTVVTPHLTLILQGAGAGGSGISYGPSFIAFEAFNARFPSLYSQLFVVDKRLRRTQTVSVDAAERAVELLDALLMQEERSLQLSDLTFRAAVAHSDHDFSNSLTQSWSVIEVLLTELWDRYLQNNRTREVFGNEQKFINADRKGRLTGPDVTASTVIEHLSLLDELPFDLYERITAARRTRNKWLHELKAVESEASAGALETAQATLSLVRGVNLGLHPSLHWHG